MDNSEEEDDDVEPMPIAGIKNVENAAIAWVMELEQAAGREPRDRHHERGFVADLESPPRLIEVKASSGSVRGADIWCEPAQYQAARADPNFYLYVVENIGQGDQRKFGLKVLHGEQLAAMLARAKEKHYYMVPWRTSEYDACPGLEALE